MIESKFKLRKVILLLSTIAGVVIIIACEPNDDQLQVGWQVTTIAGVGESSGITDGSGAIAKFNGPSDIVVDEGNNLYLSDWGNHTIRKITPAGNVSTIAGSPEENGSTDGVGDKAKFNYPVGIASDIFGNLYVADSLNHTIRKITPEGKVTTIAGSPEKQGSTDGNSSQARFNRPYDIILDRKDNIYVVDNFNHTIRKITPKGVVTTIAGKAGNLGIQDGRGSRARFHNPVGVTIDKIDNLYITDRGNDTIRKITPKGIVTTIAGSPGSSGSANGIGDGARFNHISGIAIDSKGNLYVASYINNIIKKITPGRIVTNIAGSVLSGGSVDGMGDKARFNHPYGIAIDKADNLYITDYSNNTIRSLKYKPGPSIQVE